MEKHVSKQIILSKLLDYLKIKKINVTKRGNIIMLDCPICNSGQLCANIIPNTHKVHCFKCKRKYDIIDIVKLLEYGNDVNIEEDEILHKIKEILHLEVMTKIDEAQKTDILTKFKQFGFDLVPVAKDKKFPIEKDWTNKTHIDLQEWIEWINNSLNIGVKTGKRSDITILDIDALSKKDKTEYLNKETSQIRKKEIVTIKEKNLKIVHDKIQPFIGNPLVQKTLGGEHLIYKYEGSLPKTDVKIAEIHVDVENDGGQVVICPSVVSGSSREFIELEKYESINKMPEELLKFLQSKITTPKKTYSESIIEDIQNEDFKVIDLDGKCNTTFTKLGGIIRKKLNINDTAYVLNILNNHLLEEPMDSKAMRGMVNSIEKYMGYDKGNIRNQIINYLKEIDCATQSEIELAIMGNWTKGEAKQTVTKILFQLCQDDIIINKHGRYALIKKMEWSGQLLDIGTPVDFKVPYFNDWANFNWGDLIIIGSKSKYGKTTLAMNVVQRLVNQGIVPYYIFNETGSRFAKTALGLGMKDDDFKHVFCSNPEEAILENNAVTIFDWVKPNDFARTDKLFESFVNKLQKTNGLLICFVQLRQEDTFFAKDQIGQFPCLLSRYVYNNEEGTDTKFVIDMVRDGKLRGKQFEIPCQYIWENKEVKTVEEIQGENK